MKRLIFLENKAAKDLKNVGGKWQLPLLAFLLLLLPFMAVVQHHYLGELSEAQQVSLKTNLEIAAKNFSKEFNNQLTTIQQTFRFDEDSSMEFESRLHQTYLTWKQTASFPGLIKDIYLLKYQNGKPALKLYNIQKEIFSHSDWPVELESLKGIISESLEKTEPLLISLTQVPFLFKYPLIISECQCGPISEKNINLPLTFLNDFIIIVLDPDEVRNNLISTLIKKHFPVQNEFQLDMVIAKVNSSDDVFYISDPELDIADFHNAEVYTEIGQWTEQRQEGSQIRGTIKIYNVPKNQKPEEKIYLSEKNENSDSLNLITSIKMRPHSEKWELVVKVRNNTLEGIVKNTRHRNLLISYCILTILGISMVMVYVSTRRADSLARRQLRFVSGVSHELRTPISVIRSAGENLADGVITDLDQQKQYGSLIRDEGRRLSSMVENILSFSALQNGKTTLNLKAARIIDILEECIISRSGSNDLPEPNIKIESDSNVPLVKVDYNSIKIAFSNVIENSIKYSPDDSPILIRIRYESSNKQLVIYFEDHGRGIDDEDLPYIFDPFFRGKNSEDQRTPGSGIGLSLVSDIIKKHGGRIEVKSKRHKGTTVLIFLPVISRTVEA